MDAHICGQNYLLYRVTYILHLVVAQARQQVRLINETVEVVEMVILQDRLIITGLCTRFFGFLEVRVAEAGVIQIMPDARKDHAQDVKVGEQALLEQGFLLVKGLVEYLCL